MADAERLERIVADWLDRRAKGEHVDLEEVVRKHPDLAAPLRERLASIDPSDASVSRAPTPTTSLFKNLTSGERPSFKREGEIARGGMGAILRVHDEALNRDLAMKVILDERGGSQSGDSPVVQRFLEEAQVTAQLDHPGVVPVHELGVDEEGRLFFTMKLVKGRTLGEIFELVSVEKEDWTRTRVVQLLIRICETLAFAHAKGVLHRDLKPANVMVGDFGEVYVMDWGLAKVTGEGGEAAEQLADLQRNIVMTGRSAEPSRSDTPQLTQAGDILGTPLYIAPEQAAGDAVDARSDVYSVGAMLYQLLAGHAPYADPEKKRNLRDVLMAQMAGPPTPVAERAPRAPPEILSIVEKAMAREPANRYADAEALGSDLRHFIEGRVVQAHRTGALVELMKWIRRNKPLAAALGAAVVILTVGLAATFILKTEAEREKEAARRLAYRSVLAAASANLAGHETTELQANLAAAPDDLRGWEWRYLDAHRFGEALAVLDGDSASFTPAGDLVVVEADGRVLQYDEGGANARELMPRQAQGERSMPTADGSAVVRLRYTGSEICVTALSLPTAEEIGSFTAEGALISWKIGHSAISPDGRLTLAEWEGRGTRHALIMNVEKDGKGPRIPLAPEQHLEVLAWRSDGARLLVEDDARLKILDTSTLEVLSSRDHPGKPTQGVFSTDGALIFTVAGSKAYLWDARTLEPVRWGGLDLGSDVALAMFSPDDARIAVSSWDGRLRLLATQSGVTERVLEGTGARGMSFSPDGQTLASAEHGKIMLWDLATSDSDVLRGHHRYVYPVAYSPDGKRIASGGWDGSVGKRGCLRLWDARTGEAIVALGDTNESVWWLAFTSDGSRILTCGYEEGRAEGKFGDVHVWSAETGARISTLPGGFGAAAMKPDGMHVAVDQRDAGIAVYELDSRRVVATLQIPAEFVKGPARAMAYSPDGRWLVAAAKGRIYIWNARTYGAERDFQAHEGFIWSIQVHPDGERLITTSDDDTVRIWDLRTGRRVAELLGHGADVLCAVISPVQSRVFSGGRDRKLRVWDAETHEAICALPGHESYLFSLALSPDEETVASSSGDGTVRLWRTQPLSARAEARTARRALVKEQEPLVQRLFEEVQEPATVVARLRTDTKLTGHRLEVALQIALRLSVERRLARNR